MKKRLLQIAACLLSITMLTGCTQAVPAGGENSGISAEELIKEIQSRYQEDSAYDYGDSILDLPRGQALEFILGFELSEMGVDEISDVVDTFVDVNLTQPFLAFPDYDKASNKITLLPPTNPDGLISTWSLNTEQVAAFPHTKYYLFGKDSYLNWGNIGRFYVVRYRDLETGRKLKKPVVSLVTVKGELEAPKVQFLPAENGLASFQWNKVPGAEAYVVFQATCDEKNNINGGITALGMTTDTKWRIEPPQYGSIVTANKSFRSFRYSQDDWVGGNVGNTDGYKEGEVVPNPDNYCYGVIAMNQSGTSMVSNLFNREELAANLAYSMAYHTAKANGYSDTADDIGLAPSHAWVTLCNGVTVRKKINYIADQAHVVLRRMIMVDSETGEYIEGQDVPVLEIPYMIDGCPFEGTVSIEDYQEENLEKDMEILIKRQNSIEQQGGELRIQADTYEENEEAGTETEIAVSTENGITANSALSEYLATCMLSHKKLIDISAFSKGGDLMGVEDALLEAYYQNPLILGISNYRMNQNGTTVMIVYDESAEVTKEKQDKVREKLTEVTAQIIKPEMSDLEKEFAINQYLCDTITYDMGALENAEENDFAYVDQEYIDSFTVYGALMSGKSVCAGYAAAFKLLCEAAGLNCIVTTGMLEGQLPHAWNKVQINDAWQVVDTTNNDNEELFNVLLNLPQDVSRHTLVEDKLYVLDEAIENYRAEEEENEYYRVTGKYFPTNEITQQLVQQLHEQGKVTLRTDYDLTDANFQEIAEGVYAQMDDNVRLSGYFWMGAIYLEDVNRGEKSAS